MAKVRTFDARGLGRRFRPETIQSARRAPSKQLIVTLGELMLAKQMAKAEANRREE